MNIHDFYDNLAVNAAAVAFRSFRFFEDSLESSGIQDHISRTNLSLPDFTEPGVFEVEAETLVGKLDPAFYVAQWKGPNFPTLIYHHGNNERPFDFGAASKNTFKNILLTGKPAFPANLIALRAPYHQDLRAYMKAARRLDNFTAMLTTSVCLLEALIGTLRIKYDMPILVSGISLGGWVVNLHKAYFDSSDAYIPMLAGAALDEVFTTSQYRKLTGKNAQQNPQQVHSVLNFEAAFKRRSQENVYPVLARYDAIIQFERQKVCYEQEQLSVLDKGHTTATLAAAQLREHLLTCLQKTRLEQ